MVVVGGPQQEDNKTVYLGENHFPRTIDDNIVSLCVYYAGLDHGQESRRCAHCESRAGTDRGDL